MTNRLLLTILILLCSLTGQAAKLTHLTISDGLAGIHVSHFLPDERTGMMWIATSNGINLYDGNTLRTYPMPQLAGGRPNYCYELCSDNDGNIYAATKGGVYRLERYGLQLQRVAADIGQTESVLCDGDRVYIGHRGGLAYLDPQGECHSVNLDLGETPYCTVRCLKRRSDGLIVFTTRNQVCVYQPTTGQLRRYPLERPSGLGRFDISGRLLIIGTKADGLYLMDMTTGHILHHTESFGHTIHDVRVIGEQVCIATDGEGAFLADLQDNQLTVRKHLSTDHGQLTTDAVYTYYRSANGTEWIGTARNGCFHSGITQPIFRPYRLGAFTTEGLSTGYFFAAHDVKLIAVSGGIWMIETKTGHATFYDTTPYHIHIVKSISRVGGDFYIGSLDGGVVRIKGTTHQMERVSECPELNTVSVVDAARDLRGGAWLTTNQGLYCIKPDGTIYHDGKQNTSITATPYHIEFGADGNGYVSTLDGFCIYDSQRQQYTSVSPTVADSLKKSILAFNIDRSRLIAISQNQIYDTDGSLQHLHHWTLPGGILQEQCSALVDDGHGAYWLATEKGIFRIGHGLTTPMRYGEHEGLPENSGFTQYLQLWNDTLWVNSGNGLRYAPLEALYKQNYRLSLPLLISQALTNGKVVGNHDLLRMNDRREIALSWTFLPQEVVIKPQQLNFNTNDNTLYEYRIDAGPWMTIQPEDVATMRFYLLGKHLLEIRSLGVNGTQITYSVYILPSVWFWILSILILTSVVLWIRWWWWRKRNRILLEEHTLTEQALIEESESLKAKSEEKYQNSRVNEEEMAALASRVDQYMQEEKPYQHVNLKMSDLAAALGVSPFQLSQMFSLYLNDNYYDYINRYRLEAFKQLIAQGQHHRFTVTALSEQCGFKKSSFFATFRKVEGMTPSEYINAHK